MSTEPAAPARGQLVLDGAAIARALRRMALEIIERNAPLGPSARLVGRGHLHARAWRSRGGSPTRSPRWKAPARRKGVLDASMYRDDLRNGARG